MKKKSLLPILLITAFIFTGCGGGGSKEQPVTGIYGRIVFETDATQETLLAASFQSFRPLAKAINAIKPTAMTPVVPREKVVTFRPGLSAAVRDALIRKVGGRLKKKIYGTEDTYVITVDENSFSTTDLENLAGIERIEDNPRCYPLRIPNDPFYETHQAWHYGMMDLPAAWDITTGSDEVIVAVIDSGIAPNHPEFAGRLVAGYDFVDNDDEPYDDTYIPNPLNPNSDIFSHGSMVAGIIGALTDNGAGVAGVAWKVKIMPIRVLGPSGSGDMATLASAINWAVKHGAHIINLSLGGTKSLSSVEDAIKNAVAHNVTVIAAAGNHFEGDESTGIKYPAKYDTCIAVGALGANRERASYSDYGQELDFVAPGGDGDNEYSYVASVGYNIKTKENIYVASTGTSLAAPHISGLAALLYAQGYTTPQRIYERLRAACLDLGSQGKDKYYGYGLPLATAALFDFTKFVVHLEAEDGTILSTPINAASNSTYSFRNLTPGPVRVCAWLDKNNNGQRDAGDLFGVINTTIRQNVMLEHNITVTTL